MAISHTDFSEFNSLVMDLWDAEEKKNIDLRPQIFSMRKTKRKTESSYGVGAVGEMTAWDGTVDYDTVVPLYTKNYIQQKYSKGLPFEREIFEYKEWDKVADKVKEVNLAKHKTYRSHGASLFNNAFESGYAGPDAVALCSASHPYSPSDANTQSNYNTLDLTVANFDTVAIAMMNFEDNLGAKISVMPNEIFVGNQLILDAKRIFGADKEAFTGDNTPNVHSGIKVVHVPEITGKKWFVADSRLRERYVKWYTGREPKPEHEGDFDTEIIKYKIVGRWAFGFDTWQWVYGNNA